MTTFTKRAGRLALAATVAAAFGGAAQAASGDDTPIRVPTVETLAQFPATSGFQISPDGKHMLAVQSQGDVRNILVWDLSKMSAPPTVIGSNPRSQISGASFLKNDMLQVTMFQPYDRRYDGVVKTFLTKLEFTDLEGKEWSEPMAATGGGHSTDEQLMESISSPSVLSRLVNDPDNVILENRDRGDTRAIFRYNVHKKSATRIMRLGETDTDVEISPDGQPWAKERIDSDSKGVYVAVDLKGKDGEWSEHFRSYVKDRDVVEPVAVGATPGTVVIKSNVGHEFAGLYEYDIASRKITATLFEHKFFDASGVISLRPDGSPEKDGYAGYSYEGQLGDDQYFADPKIEPVLHAVAQALGIKEIDQELVGVGSGAKSHIRAYEDGVSVRLGRYLDGEVPGYLIVVTGLTWPTEYYLMRGSKLQLLGKTFPTIDKRSLGSARFTYYQARDGLNIPAYVVVPNPTLCGPGPYPTVIHPHGGPWARDEMYYDGSGWIPLMVSQCRVVMRPQYRGSTGWGRTLWLAGDREWGQKMQDDKDDGVKWLVAQKLADPKRVAMFGFSYGGYAAMAASVRPNGLYKCAISGAGVSDIERIGAALFSSPFYQDAQEPTMRGLSPLTLADQIKIPIMVYHGDRDTTVPLIQSKLFVDKAMAAGKPVEFHVLTDYDHGRAWKRTTMAEQLTLISDYLSKGCGGGGL